MVFFIISFECITFNFLKRESNLLSSSSQILSLTLEGRFQNRSLNGPKPFKERFWNLPSDVKNKIGEEFEAKFDFLFKKLNIIHSKEIIKKTIKPVEAQLPNPPDFP